MSSANLHYAQHTIVSVQEPKCTVKQVRARKRTGEMEGVPETAVRLCIASQFRFIENILYF